MTKKLKYDILRACGFEPKAAKYFLSLNVLDELSSRVTAKTLKLKEEKESIVPLEKPLGEN